MITHLVAYAAAAVAFVAIDLVWLGIMAPRVYFPVLGDMVRQPINLPAAAAFYTLYPVGLVIFAIVPAIAAGSWLIAVLYGALFGFFTYLTYDLTSLATLRNFTWRLALIDTAWGTVLAATASGLAYAVTTALGRG